MSTIAISDPSPSAMVKFRLAGGPSPLILVPVTVDDRRTYDFILDTGASHCLLSKEVAASHAVHTEMEKEAMGAGGPIKLAYGHVNSMAVGSMRQTNVPVGITGEVERIAAAIQTRVDGDLGFAFLKDYSVTIDYQASTLLLERELPRAHKKRFAYSIPFELATPHKPMILVQAMVNHQGPFQFVFDTGASRTVVSCELAQKLSVQTTDDNPGLGGGGQIKVLAGKLDSLSIGAVAVRDHDIGVAEFLTMLSTAIGRKLDGIIGYNFLNQFRVTIDYPQQMLGLEKVGI